MIKGHHTLLLRKLFSTSKNNKISPRNVINKTKISPEKCLVTEKDRQYCVCKRRRKDIDLTFKNKRGSNLLQCQQEVNL
jgi:hypothetical protein